MKNHPFIVYPFIFVGKKIHYHFLFHFHNPQIIYHLSIINSVFSNLPASSYCSLRLMLEMEMEKAFDVFAFRGWLWLYLSEYKWLLFWSFKKNEKRNLVYYYDVAENENWIRIIFNTLLIIELLHYITITTSSRLVLPRRLNPYRSIEFFQSRGYLGRNVSVSGCRCAEPLSLLNVLCTRSMPMPIRCRSIEWMAQRCCHTVSYSWCGVS